MYPPHARAEFAGSSCLPSASSLALHAGCRRRLTFSTYHSGGFDGCSRQRRDGQGDGICFPHQTDLQDPSALDWSDAYHVLLSDRV